MQHDRPTADPTMSSSIDAGSVRRWRIALLHALDTGSNSDVPCGTCTACCRSAHFVHVDPDEADTLAHIPAALLFPAPGLPKGHQVLGYDELGRCPMLGSDGCTIYEHRPRACRVYDCRVFAATEVEITDPAKADIAQRVAQWRFSEDDPGDRRASDALRRRVAELRADGVVDPTALALGAVRSASFDEPR